MIVGVIEYDMYFFLIVTAIFVGIHHTVVKRIGKDVVRTMQDAFDDEDDEDNEDDEDLKGGLLSPSDLIDDVLTRVDSKLQIGSNPSVRDGSCIICHEELSRPTQTVACEHIFCETCIRSTLAQRNECPYCQKNLFAADDSTVDAADKNIPVERMSPADAKEHLLDGATSFLISDMCCLLGGFCVLLHFIPLGYWPDHLLVAYIVIFTGGAVMQAWNGMEDVLVLAKVPLHPIGMRLIRTGIAILFMTFLDCCRHEPRDLALLWMCLFSSIWLPSWLIALYQIHDARSKGYVAPWLGPGNGWINRTYKTFLSERA